MSAVWGTSLCFFILGFPDNVGDWNRQPASVWTLQVSTVIKVKLCFLLFCSSLLNKAAFKPWTSFNVHIYTQYIYMVLMSNYTAGSNSAMTLHTKYAVQYVGRDSGAEGECWSFAASRRVFHPQAGLEFCPCVSSSFLPQCKNNNLKKVRKSKLATGVRVDICLLSCMAPRGKKQYNTCIVCASFDFVLRLHTSFHYLVLTLDIIVNWTIITTE